jgi:hypothetical protein
MKIKGIYILELVETVSSKFQGVLSTPLTSLTFNLTFKLFPYKHF